MDEHLDLRAVPDAPIADAPWYFKLGRFLARHKIRGGARLVAEARRRGYLDRLAVYSLGNAQLRVPLWRPCNEWDEADVRGYEVELLDALAAIVRDFTGEVTLIDCGADIGTISVLLVARCPNVSSVIAFEPNPAAYAVLAENLRALDVRANARHAAVGNFAGRGTLVSPADDPSAHAMYIEPAADGDIAVQRIDDLDIAPDTNVIIKIDVEGSEAAVVEGALRTIKDARSVIVVFEAHPHVSARIGSDPVTVMRALAAVRADFTFEVDLGVERRVATDRPLFEQVPPTTVYNVIALSRGR